MSRTTKTPKQRAEEALAVADRKVKRLQHQVKELRSDLVDHEQTLAQEMQLRDFLKQHPALKATTPGTTPTQEEGTA